jgi:hypothetical protein
MGILSLSRATNDIDIIANFFCKELLVLNSVLDTCLLYRKSSIPQQFLPIVGRAIQSQFQTSK